MAFSLNPASWLKSSGGLAANAVRSGSNWGMNAAKSTANVTGTLAKKGFSRAVKIARPLAIPTAIVAGAAALGTIAHVVRERRRVHHAPGADAASEPGYMNVPEASLAGPLVTDGQWATAMRGRGAGGPNVVPPEIESPDGKPIVQLGGGRGA